METKTKHALFETQKKKSHTHTHTGTVKPPLFGPRPPPIVRPRAREKATPPTPPPLGPRTLRVLFFCVSCLFFVCFLFARPSYKMRTIASKSVTTESVCVPCWNRPSSRSLRQVGSTSHKHGNEKQKERKEERKEAVFALPRCSSPRCISILWCRRRRPRRRRVFKED